MSPQWCTKQTILNGEQFDGHSICHRVLALDDLTKKRSVDKLILVSDQKRLSDPIGQNFCKSMEIYWNSLVGENKKITAKEVVDDETASIKAPPNRCTDKTRLHIFEVAKLLSLERITIILTNTSTQMSCTQHSCQEIILKAISTIRMGCRVDSARIIPRHIAFQASKPHFKPSQQLQIKNDGLRTCA